jgi:single-stranded DNA-binding protein
MIDVNLLTLEGDIRTEVEYREDGEGTRTCSFSVLTMTYGKKIYHRVRAWGVLAGICRDRLRKGLRVRIVGPQVYIKSGTRLRPECRIEQLKILNRSAA